MTLHLDVSGRHEHDHEHMVSGVPVHHSHPHGHKADRAHLSADPGHEHVAGQHEVGEPVPKPQHRVPPVRQRHAQDLSMLAMTWSQQSGDEVLIALTATDDGGPVQLTPSDDSQFGLTRQDLDSAEAELAARITEDPDLAADTVLGEIHRLTQMSLEDALRAQGRRF